MKAPTFLEQANGISGYYRNHVEGGAGEEEYRIGLEMAQLWLDLMESENPDLQRVECLLVTLVENKDFGGSAWFDLSLGVRAWARFQISQGLIPPEFIKYVSRL